MNGTNRFVFYLSFKSIEIVLQIEVAPRKAYNTFFIIFAHKIYNYETPYFFISCAVCFVFNVL